MNLSSLIRVGVPLVLLGVLWVGSRPGWLTGGDGGRVPELGAGELVVDGVVGGVEGIGGFGEWLAGYRAGRDEAGLAVGVALAKERRRLLKALIVRDPERALERAVPAAARAGLPDEIVEQLETPISAAGGFELVVSCYTGGLVRPAGVPELERFVTIDAARYRAFTFGRRAELQTKDRISLHGIAIDDVLALSPEPVRRVAGEGGVVAGVIRRAAALCG